MIDLAINHLADRLRTLAFLDVVGGAARQQKITVAGNQPRQKVVPAVPDPTSEKAYIDLSPSSDLASIAYFEVLSNKFDSAAGGSRGHIFSCVARMVVWMNTARISPRQDIPSALALCVSKVSGTYDNCQLPVASIVVEPLQEVPRSSEIFGKYSYNEAESQFLMLPFEYFAFDFNIRFATVANCNLPNINIVAAQC